MSDLYAVHACEGRYCGLHGIESYAVIKADNEEEVIQYAQEASTEVIEDFVINEFYEELEAEGLDEEDFEFELESMIAEDIAYDYYKITVPTDLPLEELDRLYYNDPEEFLDKYCKDEDF